MTPALYKVTSATGEPIHGGSGAWLLPRGAEPGEWREETGDLVICERGLHLTSDPARWWQPGCRIWLAEAEGIAGDLDFDDRKLVCRRARLLREVTDAAELAALRIYLSGEHMIDGTDVAVALGSSHVEAWESSHVEARESSHVEAWESSHVEARESSHVEARGSAHVEAADSATIVTWRGKPGVRIDQRAVWIERGDGSGPPVVHVASPPGAP